MNRSSSNDMLLPTMQRSGDHQQHTLLTTQPGGHSKMSTRVNARNALDLPLNAGGERLWSYGLCGCFSDCSTCCLAWWCPCMLFAKNKSRYEALNSRNQPHPSDGDGCSGDCALHACLNILGGWGCLLAMANRKNIRDRYSVDSNGCNDLCVSWCCHVCALTQESRELDLEEDFLLGKRVDQNGRV